MPLTKYLVVTGVNVPNLCNTNVSPASLLMDLRKTFFFWKRSFNAVMPFNARLLRKVFLWNYIFVK